MFKPILISIAPNLEFEDFKIALKLIFSPRSWQKGNKIASLEKKLQDYFKKKNVFTFNSGRSALYVALRALDLKPEDEVLVQAFTCVAVPNAVLWTGAKPIFVDIEKDSYSMDIDDLRKKINSRTKAIIVQHSFGIPDKIDKIKEIAKKAKIFLIEDCAHSLGSRLNARKIGTFGDLTMLSFGRDKVISSVFGGALIVNNSKIANKVKSLYSLTSFPKNWWIAKQLLHPIFFTFIIPLYNFLKIGKFTIGKALIFLLRELNLISLPIESCEKLTKKPSIYPQKLPNALAALAVRQMTGLENFNQKRRKIAAYYYENLKTLALKKKLNFLRRPDKLQEVVFLRFPIKVNQARKLVDFAKEKGILLGNWYRTTISPPGIDLEKMGYKKGSYPNAEKASLLVVNLPTNPRMNLKDAKKVVTVIKEFFEKKEMN